MKVALTLKDFLDTYFDNVCTFIIVVSSPGYKYIIPTRHAWSNSSKDCQDKWNELEKAGKISRQDRALSFADTDFDVDKLYGEYADWFVESFERACFINPFTKELDEDCTEITIYKEPADGVVPFAYKEEENKK